MRILIITDGIYPFSMGGSHRLVYELARSLTEEGHYVTCIVPEIDKTSSFSTNFAGPNITGMRIIRFPINKSNFLSKARSYFKGFLEPVKQELASGNYDVLNVHYLPALVSLLSLPLVNHHVRYTFHGPWAAEYRLSLSGKMDSRTWLIRNFSRLIFEPALYFIASNLERIMLKKCDRFLVLSDYMKNILVNTYRIPSDRVCIVPSGVDHERFHPGVDLNLRRSLTTDSATVFVTIRRLEKRMGIDILLLACALLKKRHNNFLLLIGGQGPHKPYLTSLIISLGLAEHVKMLGFVPENKLRDYLATSDLFILPSRDLEGFGLVVLESLACGTPILVPPSGGPQEVIRKFDIGFVLDKLTPVELSNRLLQLIQAGAFTQAREASATFSSGYSWKKFAAEFAQWAK